jgi:cytochrome c-type biogenesis protein CcmE
MSRIDEELEQAVRDAEAPRDRANPDSRVAGAVGVTRSVPSKGRSQAGDPALPVVADAEERKRGWGLLAGLVALMGGILVLVFNGSEDAVVYSYKVDELKARAAELGERQVRVQGSLVYGTLVKRDKPCEHQFLMTQTGEKNGAPLKVSFPQCVVPDTFREVKGVDVEVTAEGRLKADGTLEATKLFAKCPSKYEMRETAESTGVRPDHSGGPKPELTSPTAEGIR